MTQQPVRSPCIGLCSTTYGDLICRGCRRHSEEITQWPGMDHESKKTIVDRLDNQIASVLSQFLVIDDPELLRQRLQQLQINHDPNRSPWSWLLVLLVKKHDLINNTAEFGFRSLSSLSLSKLARESMREMYQNANS